MDVAGPAQLRARAEGLGPYLGKQLGGDITVVKVTLAPSGMSATTLLLDLSDGRKIVLRGQPEEAAGTKPEVQFHVLRAASTVSVPAPPALFWESNLEVLGAPFLATGRLPGSAVFPWSREGRTFLVEAGRGPAGTRLLEILAAIHSVPVDDPSLTAAFGAKGPTPTKDLVDRLTRQLDASMSAPEPIVADALGWLRAHLVEPKVQTLVHGDYRAGNLLFVDREITGILDWEFAHRGDPARDVAWLMAKSNRISDDMACDMIPLSEVLSRYERAGGRPIDPASLLYWDVFMLVDMVRIWLETTAGWRAGTMKDIRIARWTYTLPKIRLMLSDALEKADP